MTFSSFGGRIPLPKEYCRRVEVFMPRCVKIEYVNASSPRDELRMNGARDDPDSVNVKTSSGVKSFLRATLNGRGDDVRIVWHSFFILAPNSLAMSCSQIN